MRVTISNFPGNAPLPNPSTVNTAPTRRLIMSIFNYYTGNNHWLLELFSNCCIEDCDSSRTNLSHVAQKSVKSIYLKCVNNTGKIPVSFFKVQKQSDRYNCSSFVIAFSAELLNGSPMDVSFHIRKI